MQVSARQEIFSGGFKNSDSHGFQNIIDIIDKVQKNVTKQNLNLEQLKNYRREEQKMNISQKRISISITNK